MSDAPPAGALRFPAHPTNDRDKYTAGDEYAIEERPEAQDGIVLWIRHGKRWHVNSGQRGIVRHLLQLQRRTCAACGKPYADALEALQHHYSGGESLCWIRNPACVAAAGERT